MFSRTTIAAAVFLVSACADRPPTVPSDQPAGDVVPGGPQLSTSVSGTIPTSGTPGISGFTPMLGSYSTNNPTGLGGALFIQNLTTLAGQIYIQDPLTGQLLGHAPLHPSPFTPFQATSTPHGTRFCVIAIMLQGGEDPNDRGTCYAVLPFGLQTTEEYTAFWAGGVSNRSPSVRRACSSIGNRIVCVPIGNRPPFGIRSKPGAGGVRG
jgi:hypothetical protein